MDRRDDQVVPLPDLPERVEAAVTGLRPMSLNLEPDVARFAEELRRIFGGLEMSLGQYAHIHHRDKSGLSRYLSGSRVPPRAILDELISDFTKICGIPLTAEADSHLRQLHLAALACRDQRAYQVQVITDKLENATTELWQTKRQVKELEEELARRESTLHDLTAGTRQLQRAWDEERERADEELENAQERYMKLKAEYDRLVGQAAELRTRLAQAQERELKARERCRRLEQQLDAIEPNPGGGVTENDDATTANRAAADSPLNGRQPRSAGSNWRETVFNATGGLVRVRESATQRRRELVRRAQTPVAGGHHRVAVIGLKGGVGKTTTTIGLGATLATVRGDRIIAVDASPDRGTLSDRVRLETSATVRDLLNERQQVYRYADVRAFTSQDTSRLEVLASDRDPAMSVAFSKEDYLNVARMLEQYYSICITDCSTGLVHSAMAGALSLADQIILVSSPSVDGVDSADATLDWLEVHDCGELVHNAVVVLSVIRPPSKNTVGLDSFKQHFAARCREVIQIPYDAHLEEGTEISLERLSPATTQAWLRLAAAVGEAFAWSPIKARTNSNGREASPDSMAKALEGR